MLTLCSLALVGACGPDPPTWPSRFKLTQKRIPEAGSPIGPGNATTVTYYDSIRGANLILIRPDSNMSDILHDLELDSKQSYYFTPARRTCTPMTFPVGILTRSWLHNATYLGLRSCPYDSSRKCAAWTKADFIDYFAYADSATCEPAAWRFWTMKAWFVTLAYTADEEAPPGSFDPPEYCNTTVVL